MTTFFGPYFRSPFTDLTASPFNNQHFHKCGKMELVAMECLEAYGLERGKKKCSDLLEDLFECQTMTKQRLRYFAMVAEREKQIKEGTLKGDEKYSKAPRIDSY